MWIRDLTTSEVINDDECDHICVIDIYDDWKQLQLPEPQEGRSQLDISSYIDQKNNDLKGQTSIIVVLLLANNTIVTDNNFIHLHPLRRPQCSILMIQIIAWSFFY